MALRAAVERMHAASGADIIALYPYDEETDTFYAPVALGIPEMDIVHALPDLADQLRRFRNDAAEGKTPDDLSPGSYGPSAWLLTTRRPLISHDAPREIDSSFVRRHHISAMIGLPLVVGARVVALLYLNYVTPEDGQRDRRGDAGQLARLQEEAAGVAVALDAARHAEEAGILRAIGSLVSDFSAMPSGVEDQTEAGRLLAAALGHILSAAGLGAAALYVPDPGEDGFVLAGEQGATALWHSAARLQAHTVGEIAHDPTLVSGLGGSDLHPVLVLAPRGQGHQGAIVFADCDPLALQRRLPAEHMLLQTGTDLVGAMLKTERLIADLGETNRTLGAVTRLSTRLFQPGVTQQEALATAVAALTDPALPELDFELANLFLIDSTPEGRLAVYQSTGATSSPNIHTMPNAAAAGRQVPAWAAPGVRLLDPHDVVAYVATRRRAVVVAPASGPAGASFVTGYPEELLSRKQIPILKADGSTAGYVHAARLKEAADRAPLREEESESGAYNVSDDFTLNQELFEAYGHDGLIRVFVPFGADAGGGRASGVLEAGYHISRQHRLERVQIEALRACAASIAVAVETARLYEDVTRRARQLEMVTEVGRAIATSIDLEQTLSLIARNMARVVDTSVCLIALLDEDGSAWYGAASSDQEDVWRHRRVERPEQSIVFEVADRGRPIVVEDALNHELVSSYMARIMGIRSLVALPLLTGDGAIGAVVLGEHEHQRVFTSEEIDRAQGLANQAAIAIQNARRHAREEEEHHIQKDVVLVGFGQWGQKAYKHLVLLKSFFNFRIHVVEADTPGRREALDEKAEQVLENGDLFYWDAPSTPARNELALELEPSCYVITYIATPAETHLPMLKTYYDLSNVVLIEKPLGAPSDEYRAFLDTTDGSVQVIAADHYWFKLEVRLLELLLTEERNLKAFLDEIEEIEIEILEEQPPGGSGAQIGMIADLIPHAFAVLSLFTPLDRVRLAPHRPLQIGCYQPISSDHETYARLTGSFEQRGRPVRVTIDVGKGVANAKWIKLSGERRMGGRRSFYKFDFSKGEAMDGTQSALRAATRPIRQPGVPDNAHLSMLRHVVEKKNPAVGILSIREAIRANTRIQELERMATELLAAGQWTPYTQGQRPAFPVDEVVQLSEAREAVT